MKPNQYVEYSKVIDYFSDPVIFPIFQQCMDVLAVYLSPRAKVTDVEAGTGFYSQKLLEAVPRVRLTV